MQWLTKHHDTITPQHHDTCILVPEQKLHIVLSFHLVSPHVFVVSAILYLPPSPSCVLLIASQSCRELRDWLATCVLLNLPHWHYKFPCKPLILISTSIQLYIRLYFSLLFRTKNHHPTEGDAYIVLWLQKYAVDRTFLEYFPTFTSAHIQGQDDVTMIHKVSFIFFQKNSKIYSVFWRSDGRLVTRGAVLEKDIIDCQFSSQTPSHPFSSSPSSWSSIGSANRLRIWFFGPKHQGWSERSGTSSFWKP